MKIKYWIYKQINSMQLLNSNSEAIKIILRLKTRLILNITINEDDFWDLLLEINSKFLFYTSIYLPLSHRLDWQEYKRVLV